MDPGLDDIHIGRIAGARGTSARWNADLDIGLTGQLPFGDESRPRSPATRLRKPGCPRSYNAEKPRTAHPVPGMDGLAEEKPVADDIVQIVPPHVFSVAEIQSKLEEIKRLAGPDFERISIIKMDLEKGAGAARPEVRSLVEQMRPQGQGDVERFFLIDFLRRDPGQLPLQKPAQSPPGADERDQISLNILSAPVVRSSRIFEPSR